MAHWEMWWLIWRCGGSFGDVVAHLEMCWLILRCGGSFGDAVAHLVASQTSGAEGPGSNPDSPTIKYSKISG